MSMKVNQTRGTQTAPKSKPVRSKDYNKQQEALAKQIKMPNGVDDLKANARIKAKQIRLAKANGDIELAQILQGELNKINGEIKAKETSVFGSRKQQA